MIQKLMNIIPLIRWWREQSATALMETVVLFPVLITLLMGCFDIGQGIVVNQKTIGSSQIIGDLIARQRNVTMAVVDDIITAGQLAMEPHNMAPFGYDIVSIQFDADGDPEVLWRVRNNMDANADAVASTEGLGAAGEGVIVVTTVYHYTPYFSNFLVDGIDMEEVAFLRGRRSAVITCSNCPTS